MLRCAASGHGRLQALDAIERNARILTQIVSDLLDASRMTAGEFTLQRRPVAVRDVLAAAIQTLRPAAEAKGVEIRTSFEVPAPRVWADPGRLRQALANILSNAVKFAARQTRRVARAQRGLGLGSGDHEAPR